MQRDRQLPGVIKRLSYLLAQLLRKCGVGRRPEEPSGMRGPGVHSNGVCAGSHGAWSWDRTGQGVGPDVGGKPSSLSGTGAGMLRGPLSLQHLWWGSWQVEAFQGGAAVHAPSTCAPMLSAAPWAPDLTVLRGSNWACTPAPTSFYPGLAG